MVELISIFNSLKPIGDWFSDLMTRFIQYLSEIGINISTSQGKIINFILLLGIAYFIIKTMERPLKWILVGAILILAVSIITTFFP